MAEIGVEVQLGVMVTTLHATGFYVIELDCTQRQIEWGAKVWAAGVQASPLGVILAEQSGASLDRAGRIAVNQEGRSSNHPEVFVVGDMASLSGYPGRCASRDPGRALRGEGDQGKTRCTGHRWPPRTYRAKGLIVRTVRFSVVLPIGKVGLYRCTGVVPLASCSSGLNHRV